MFTWKKPSVGRSGYGGSTLYEMTASALNETLAKARVMEARSPSLAELHFYCAWFFMKCDLNLPRFIDFAPIDAHTRFQSIEKK